MIHIFTHHTYYIHIRITYSSPVDEAKHKSSHLGCEDYHDDDKKLMQIQRKVYNIKNDEMSNTPETFKEE